MVFRKGMPVVAVVLSVLLALPLYSQEPAQSAVNLQILQGEGEITGIGQRVKVPPAVRIQDAQGRPLADATVLFALPTEGVTGDFGKGSKTFSVITDKTGIALARNLQVADMPGPLEIYITAAYQGVTLTATVTQHVVAVPGAKTGGGGGSSKKLLWILLAVGLGGAGAAVALTQGGKSSPSGTTVAPPAPITISIGSSTIGPPK